MSRYAREWVKQLRGHDPNIRLVMLILADDTQGSDHRVRIYDDRLERETGLPAAEVNEAVRLAVDEGLLEVTEPPAWANGARSDRSVRDLRLLIPSDWRTQGATRPKREAGNLDDVPTAVYLLYNAAGVLVYVGISENPQYRFAQHEAAQPWWREVVTREITWHDRRQSAEAEEERVINQDDPLYNNDSPGRRQRQHAESMSDRYIVANKAYGRFKAFCDALVADIVRGDYNAGLIPEAAELASRYGTDATTVSRSLRYLASIEVLGHVNGEHYKRVLGWGRA